jgi:hypothetical protein
MNIQLAYLKVILILGDFQQTNKYKIHIYSQV